MIAKFKTETCGDYTISPGDLVLYDDQLCVALNKIQDGYLLRDCNSSKPVQVDKKQSLEIVREIYIQKR